MTINLSGFSYSINTNVVFERKDLLALMVLSESHYDVKCKDASRVGGFLYGAWNALLLGDDKTAEWSFDNHDLQTLCKIVEMPGGQPYRKPLADILESMQRESRRLNEDVGDRS